MFHDITSEGGLSDAGDLIFVGGLSIASTGGAGEITGEGPSTVEVEKDVVGKSTGINIGEIAGNSNNKRAIADIAKGVGKYTDVSDSVDSLDVKGVDKGASESAGMNKVEEKVASEGAGIARQGAAEDDNEFFDLTLDRSKDTRDIPDKSAGNLHLLLSILHSVQNHEQLVRVSQFHQGIDIGLFGEWHSPLPYCTHQGD
jgi:hypothetical protein